MESDLIFDVGMHKGEDSEFYLKKGFKVVGIEALPALCQDASQRLHHFIENGQLTILNVAIAERDGPLVFWENTSLSTFGTADPEFRKSLDPKGRYSKETTVLGRDFKGILSEYGIPYYLKVDIEGADLICLRALKQFDSRPKYISIESTQHSWRELLEEFVVFKDLGYSKFKIVAQDRWRHEKCPFPAREGQYVDFEFPDISSGPFGEEAPGTWMDEVQAIETYSVLFRRHRIWNAAQQLRLGRFVKDPGWFDTHAALG